MRSAPCDTDWHGALRSAWSTCAQPPHADGGLQSSVLELAINHGQQLLGQQHSALSFALSFYM